MPQLGACLLEYPHPVNVQWARATLWDLRLMAVPCCALVQRRTQCLPMQSRQGTSHSLDILLGSSILTWDLG